MAAFNRMWALITQDPFILTLVSDGVQLDFLTIPPKTSVYQSHLSTIQNARISSEIASLLSKGVITPSTRDRCIWLSPGFTRINKDGSYRLILNLKCLNSYIAHIHFKMESVTDVLHILKPCLLQYSSCRTPSALFFFYYSRAPTINIRSCQMAVPKLLCFLRRFCGHLLPIYVCRGLLCCLHGYISSR